MSTPTKIDFSSIEGPVYTGRDRGEQLRQTFHLDESDLAENEIDVIIPSSTYSISSSFFLGLFGPSVVRAGNRDSFYKKYKFQSSEFLHGIVDKYVERALQERNLFTK